MRFPLSKLLLAVALTAASPALAQLELPAPSPAAKVMQRVGLTDVTVEYSSPAVKGRTIWGDLVPFDKIWRTGANAATKITFSRDVTVDGKSVAAGTYAIVTLPTKKGWTFVLSKATDLWASGKQYDEKDDAVRVEAKTTAIPHRERFAFIISDATEAGASLDIEWEKLRISVPFATDTAKQALASIDKELGMSWRPHLNAARYMADTAKDLDKALALVEKSIGIQSTWFNNWVKADILNRKGDKAEALKFAQIAWDLGNKDSYFFSKAEVEKALKDWK